VTRAVALIVCGSVLRGDDGVAIGPARAAVDASRGPVDLHEIGQLTPELLLELGDTPCVVVDMVRGIAPGQLLELPLAELARLGRERAPRSGQGMVVRSATSSHAMPLEQTLALVEIVAGRVPEGTFLGIGGAEIAVGAPLSEPVAAALPAFTDAITSALARLSDG
jgi:hydrogenase maturation protease